MMQHDTHPSHGGRLADQRGFTLVEILVASLLFAIGMMAAMAMQYSVLGGFANTRDMTNATQVAERVVHLMKMESQQWRDTTQIANANLVPSYSNANTNDKLWSGSSDEAILERAVTSAGWQPVFREPVDARLTKAGMRRYCVYVRGNQMQNNASSSGQGLGLAQIQVAVLYPSPDQTFPTSSSSSSATAYGRCTGFETDLGTLLEPASWGSVPRYEEEGYRAVHMGAHILQRRHLGGSNQRFGRFGS